MQTQPFSLMALLGLILPSQLAMAGVGSSGGGKAVICRNTSGQIAFGQLLDLYEVVAVYHNELLPPLATLEEERRRTNERIRTILGDQRATGPAGDEENMRHLQKELNSAIFLPTPLPRTDDVGTPVALPEGCKLEQVAVFEDDPVKLTIYQEIWDYFDSQNKNALLMHEFFYWNNRRVGDTNSETSRWATNVLFANKPVLAIDNQVPSDASYCETDRQGVGAKLNSFYMFSNPNDRTHTRLQFMILMGRPTWSPLKVDIPFDLINLDQSFDRRLPLPEGPFRSHSIRVINRLPEPLKLSLYDGSDRLIESAELYFCLPFHH